MKSPNSKISVLYTSILILAIMISSSIAGAYDNVQHNLQLKTIRINPEYKINRISNGSVVVTSRNAGNSDVKHEFTDFYADLLMAAYRKQGIDYIIEHLRKKYYLSEDDCRRELKHALNILAEWKIILRDDDYAQQR